MINVSFLPCRYCLNLLPAPDFKLLCLSVPNSILLLSVSMMQTLWAIQVLLAIVGALTAPIPSKDASCASLIGNDGLK